MPCFGCNVRRDCRRGRRGNAAGSDAAVSAVRELTARSSCAQTAAGEAGQAYLRAASDEAVLDTCCDPFCGCREFDARLRNPFWPRFAHPRWLRCQLLYARSGRCGRR